MKILLVFLAVVLSTNNIFPQVFWENIGDFGSLRDIKVNSHGDIFICNGSGILRTTNDGVTWESLNLPRSISRLAINDSNHIFASDNDLTSNSIYKSTDNGNNWDTCTVSGGKILALYISREGFIYGANGNGQFFKSTDNGITWSTISTTCGQINGITSCSNGQIFLATESNGIFSSTDSGISWFPLSSTSGEINYITSNDSDYIFATGFNIILISKDYGNTWSTAWPFYSKGILTIDSSGTLYAGFYSNHRSTDNGTNWSNILGPINPDAYDTKGNVVYLINFEGVFKYDPDAPPPLGSNYLPLKTGNKWQYIKNISTTNYDNYSLDTITVLYDTLINNITYYKLNSIEDLVRYSEEEKKIYLRWNDSDYVHVDFNKIPDIMYQIFGGWHNFYNVKAISGRHNIFNKYMIYGGFIESSTFTYEKVLYTEEIGMTSDQIGMSHLSDTKKIIQAIIYDSTNTPVYYTNHYKPEISLIPVTEIDSTVFIQNLQVDHENTKIPTPYSGGLNFINHVKLYSYYTDGTNFIHNRPIPASNTGTINYTAAITIDTALIKNGYTFFYQLTAVDHGIIPDSSSSPDSGYYQCVWKEPVANNDENQQPLYYKLYQNNPNPFNPFTKIRFRTAHPGFISLKIFDILGGEAASLISEEKPAGEYEVLWDANNHPSGVYFCRLRSGSYTETKKMILIK